VDVNVTTSAIVAILAAAAGLALLVLWIRSDVADQAEDEDRDEER
jgi:hypothetical protein